MLSLTRWVSGSVNLMVSVKLCSDDPCCHGNKHLEISTENSPFVVVRKLPPTGNWGRQRQTPPRLRPRRVCESKATDSLWNKVFSLLSSVMAVVRLPISCTSSMACCWLHGPAECVSKEIWKKRRVCWRADVVVFSTYYYCCWYTKQFYRADNGIFEKWDVLLRKKWFWSSNRVPAYWLGLRRGAFTCSRGDAENARHENAGLENAAQTCRFLQGVENARLENVAQKYRAGKCRNGKSGKRIIWKAVCKIISWHYAYRMHELNNTAKAPVCQFTSSSSRVSTETITLRSQNDDDDNQEDEVSVDSGDDQPSADVESQDLCEVCLIAQRDTWQALVPCGHIAFVVPVSLRSRKKVAAAPYAARQSPWFCASSSF